MVTDLENRWSVLMRTVGKGHDKMHHMQEAKYRGRSTRFSLQKVM
jgi:hypothetical protein